MQHNMKRYPLKEYQIWVGYCHFGQGYDPSTEPQLVDVIEAPNFKVACVLHELRSKLTVIENSISKDEYVDHQTCRWFYNFDSNSNSWTGKYFETKEEAEQSFHKK